MLTREQASFWAGKRDSHHHSSTSFSENVVVAGSSYQMYEVLTFRYQERA